MKQETDVSENGNKCELRHQQEGTQENKTLLDDVSLGQKSNKAGREEVPEVADEPETNKTQEETMKGVDDRGRSQRET